MAGNFQQLVFEIIAQDKEASAAFDRFRKSVDQTSESVDKNSSVLDKNSKSLDSVGKSAASAAPQVGGLGSAMPALLGAATALAPIAFTVGAGLAGLGLAAAGTLSPVLKAAQGTGGLAKNLHGLDPEQQAAAKSLLDLGKSYHSFEQALAPVVLKDFGSALGIARHGMTDLLPVSGAVGKSLGGLLDRLDAEFQSGVWKSFFSWMGQQAGPDMKLIGDSVINLTDALPSLLENLQPAAMQLLGFVDDATKLIDVASKTDHALTGMGSSASGSSKFLGVVAHAAENAVFPITTAGSWALKLADHLDGTAKSAPPAGTAIKGVGEQAQTAQVHIQSMADSVTALMTAESKSLNTQLAYSNALIASKNDSVSLATALKGSSDKIGLQTTAQRASFSAANTYISDLENAAQQAIASGKGASGAARQIADGLPILEQAKTKNRAYWQEVATLKGWLDKLRAEKNIRLLEVVTGSGSWTMHNPTGQSLPGGFPGGTGAAAGMLVSGGTPGRDSVPILAMPGETVVPAHLTPMVAPLMKAHGVPGFASGGIVPRYAGNVGGMGPWASHNTSASLTSIAQSMGAAVAAAVARSAAAGFGTAGPGGGAPAANAALARRMMPAWGSGAAWDAWNFVAMRESGWNQFARNGSSGAYGIPQALPGSKMGPAANPPMSNPAAQISWMIGYMQSRYGGPLGAAAHEMSAGWYDQGGYLPTGLSLAYNGTGRPEPVGGAGGVHLHGDIIVNMPFGSTASEVKNGLVKALDDLNRQHRLPVPR